jgi:hypothetical protein
MLEHVETSTAFSTDASAILARLLDLRGSVELARGLGASKIPSTDSIDADAAKRMRAMVRDEANGLRIQAERATERFMTKLPDEVSALEAFTASAKKNRSPREVAVIATMIWAPLADEASSQVSHVRNQFRALRKELGPDLAALSQSAARLERLDSLLGNATEVGIDARISWMIPATKLLFTRELSAAMEGLPREADSAMLRAWLRERDLIRGIVCSLEKIIMATVDFESDRLDALVEAVTRA